ncbi:MAG: T9SS type A sorting domain-containing protein [Bacteroidetes bacterium]|nr:T9SS type A sorting domain-containing protein [Bacteroidota bacterium]
MNRRLLICWVFLCLSIQLIAQAQTNLDVNNVSARIVSNGSLFWDMNGTSQYNVPKVVAGSGDIKKSPIFMATLWLHAIDSNGDTLISVDLYHQKGTDFGQGVLPPGAGLGFTPILDQRIFNLSRTDIQEINLDTSNITQDIKDWPTYYVYKGDTVRLAPYVDVNHDGYYNPKDQDYPFVYGDQSLLFYYHDMVPHALSKSKPLGIQIQAQAYAFATNDKINDYVFVQYKIISQNQDLRQFRVGVFSDYDLGNYSDDYVATDTSRNMTFVYNGDNDDEGITGYGLNPPAFATVFINQPLCASCMMQNSDSSDFRTPNNEIEFRNALYGLSTSGDSMEINAPGFPAGTHSQYHFTGMPGAGQNGWSMDNDPRFQPDDYRMMGITGQDSLMQGDTFRLLLLFAYARTNTGGAIGSVQKLQNDVDDIFNRWFTKPQIPANCFSQGKKSGSGVDFVLPKDEIRLANIYPNPANNHLQIELISDERLVRYSIYNSNGQTIQSGSSQGDFTVEVASLPNGIYFLRLEDAELERQESFKFILQH